MNEMGSLEKLGLQKTLGSPEKQEFGRFSDNMFGINNYMDTSGSCEDGFFQPCAYKKYLTYTAVASTGLPGEVCFLCPFWMFEFTFCKVIPQWALCLGTIISGGGV